MWIIQKILLQLVRHILNIYTLDFALNIFIRQYYYVGPKRYAIRIFYAIILSLLFSFSIRFLIIFKNIETSNLQELQNIEVFINYITIHYIETNSLFMIQRCLIMLKSIMSVTAMMITAASAEVGI